MYVNIIHKKNDFHIFNMQYSIIVNREDNILHFFSIVYLDNNLKIQSHCIFWFPPGDYDSQPDT